LKIYVWQCQLIDNGLRSAEISDASIKSVVGLVEQRADYHSLDALFAVVEKPGSRRAPATSATDGTDRSHRNSLSKDRIRFVEQQVVIR
jgi:hypothetical protein